ncbi:hypothetical protein Ppa06_57680 [Planomonospora parontospora subsp. parontospora]|uniref:Uncharacterized protein n=2 Tax=Planomonospora parontospora TaxID=58119 RepID=A0AA37BLT0_9ACTN|nr:hypothetical protein [Planomonospora parontospora]GGK90675.1 hypothetical protein GCM10010126_57630 [Planomonospora parontospora]GII11970.1 hypothetical protein Ppa06_57680 [Planomonospora parontospora subsp. parontospora]
MIHPIYVVSTPLRPEDIRQYATEHEIVLEIGEFRIAVPKQDMTALQEAAALGDRLTDLAHAFRVDVGQQGGRLIEETKARENAAARCVCGMPHLTGYRHRTDGPCYAEEAPRTPILTSQPPAEQAATPEGEIDTSFWAKPLVPSAPAPARPEQVTQP